MEQFYLCTNCLASISHDLFADYHQQSYHTVTSEKNQNGLGPDITRGINVTLTSMSSVHASTRKVYVEQASVAESRPRFFGNDLNYSTSGSSNSPSEHLYDLPLNQSLLDSPSSTEGFHLLPSVMSPSANEREMCVAPKISNGLFDADNNPQRSISPLSNFSEDLSGK